MLHLQSGSYVCFMTGAVHRTPVYDSLANLIYLYRVLECMNYHYVEVY